jgi:hypothetical protein
MRIAKASAQITLITLLVTGLWAQTASTSLNGTVTDSKGAVIAGAKLILSNPQTGFSREVQTSNQGVYQFLQVPPATYELSISASGFAAQKQKNVILTVNTPASLNVAMKVAGTTTVVEVVGTAAPLVNMQDASLGHAFNSEQIAYLPFEGREAASILSLQPGVAFTGNGSHISQASDSRSGSVNGARSDQTNVTLDGVDNNDQTQGLAFTGALRATLDSLQEFRVTTSNATADAGRSSGGQVALVTKSGTNSIHGTAYEYYRPPFGAANDWFNENSELANGLPNKPGFLLRNTFGVTFGGPIKKNRLFYFLAYEGQRTRENLQVTRIVPSAGLRNGQITYPCSQDPTCPAGGTFTLSQADLATMDPNCTGLGTCPLGPGANPAVMQMFQQYPLPNANLGDGLDLDGFTFSSPLPGKLDTYVAKIDYSLTANGSHQLFVRGGLMSDRGAAPTDPTSYTGSGGSEFPGQPANITHLNNTKGIIVGLTSVLRANLVNSFHYGFIRQGLGDFGQQSQHYVNFRGLDNLTAQTPTSNTRVPVSNFVDDVTWTKGSHTMEFGGNLRIVNNIRNSNSTSFFSAQTDSFWLSGSCISTCGTPVSWNPASFGFPAVDGSFSASYDYAATALAGLITQVGSNYNLTKTLAALPEGSAVSRHFRNHELEFYGQDSYHAKPNLTITYGLRYTLLQPPYETTGTQVAPDGSIDQWFKQRGAAMLQGQAYEPLLSFSLSGQANGKKPYWNWDHSDLAPRVSIAYSPKAEGKLSKLLWGGAGKSSVRVGYGMYYDHFGEGIVNSFDQLGSFGLTTSLSNPAGVQTVDGSARFSAINTIPTTSASTSGDCPVAPCPLVEAAPTGSFPVTPPAGLASGYAITWGLDDRLKTPYSHLIDWSITRELPKGFVFEAAYVGRFAHRLLQEKDLAMPANLRDPKSNTDYFTAATQLAKQYRAGVPIQNVQPIPFWENMFPAAAGPSATQIGGDCGKPGTSCSGLTAGALPPNVTATQAMYDLFAFNAGNETTALEFADVPGLVSATGCYPACASITGTQTPFTFYSPQYSSLYAWTSDGNSAYNAGQFSLRRRMSAGLQFDLNYTYSKSMDIGSNAERINHFQGSGFASQVLNSWFPKQLRAASDFDTTHQVNANWVYQLPFGRGQRFGNGVNRFVDAIVGGWTVSGLWRWTTGYPFSISSGFGWATNFDEQSLAVLNGKRPRTGTFILNGQPNVFSNPNNVSDPNSAINQFRAALPGESGQRNNLRGPGTFNVDSSVSKSWRITERQSLRFSAEAFNLTNTPRFDVGSMQLNLAGNSITNSTSFGNFNSTLSNPRVLEFALRYSF